MEWLVLGKGDLAYGENNWNCIFCELFLVIKKKRQAIISFPSWSTHNSELSSQSLKSSSVVPGGKISKAKWHQVPLSSDSCHFHQWPHVDPYLTPLCNSAWWRHTHSSHFLTPSSLPPTPLAFKVFDSNRNRLLKINEVENLCCFTKDGCLRMHHKVSI